MFNILIDGQNRIGFSCPLAYRFDGIRRSRLQFTFLRQVEYAYGSFRLEYL